MSDSQLRKYNKITYETRKKLIEMVCKEELNLDVACKVLGVKPSTARAIVKTFQLEGRIFEKKEEKIKRKVMEELEKAQELAGKNEEI